jgi:hypothetical protein
MGRQTPDRQDPYQALFQKRGQAPWFVDNTVRSRDDMGRHADRLSRPPAGLRGCRDPGCRTMNVPFGIALCQRIGRVERLLRLIGLGWLNWAAAGPIAGSGFCPVAGHRHRKTVHMNRGHQAELAFCAGAGKDAGALDLQCPLSLVQLVKVAVSVVQMPSSMAFRVVRQSAAKAMRGRVSRDFLDWRLSFNQAGHLRSPLGLLNPGQRRPRVGPRLRQGQPSRLDEG